MKRLITIAVGLLVVACAQDPAQVTKLQKFGQQGGAAIQNHATNLSRGISGGSRQATNRGVRAGVGYFFNFEGNQGISFFNNWIPSSGAPLGGFFLRQDSRDEVSQCASVVEQIPEEAAYYDLMVATLARCLDRLITYQNPLMTYAYRNLPSEYQTYFRYSIDYNRPAPFGFGGWNYNQFNRFAGTGIGSDLQ